MKRVIVVGSAGQDGRILLERMRREGRLAVGIDLGRIESTHAVDLAPLDVGDAEAVEQAIAQIAPDEVYYLAAFHHAAEERLENDRLLLTHCFDVHVGGLLSFLEAIRRRSPQTRLFYAGSARVFGVPAVVPQEESTPFNPDCAYGISKAAGMRCVRFYRREHSLFAVSGILYNHESPYRGPHFVTQKIVRGALAIRAGTQAKLVLGDLDAVVDWGYAPDYVDAMVRMLALPEPDDYIVATGEAHTVREFVQITFDLLKLEWQRYVETAPSLIRRPKRALVGNPARLRAATGWKPSVTLAQLVGLLIEAQERSLGTG